MAVTALPDKLNLGCGRFKKPGFLNVDGDGAADPDRVMNLDELPYPFPAGHFRRIEADHVLEHLQNPFAVMAEMHRILAPGGELHIRVPHFSRGFTHADHKRGFDVTFPFYFDPRFRGGYCGTPFVLEKLRLRWSAQPYLKKTVLSPPLYYLAEAAGRVIDVFANLSPSVCSRGWCFWVGGFEEIEYRFRKPSRAS
jgi:SAM-dependent methyltransferase